jgi:hypothetical protein
LLVSDKDLASSEVGVVRFNTSCSLVQIIELFAFCADNIFLFGAPHFAVFINLNTDRTNKFVSAHAVDGSDSRKVGTSVAAFFNTSSTGSAHLAVEIVAIFAFIAFSSVVTRFANSIASLAFLFIPIEAGWAVGFGLLLVRDVD